MNKDTDKCLFPLHTYQIYNTHFTYWFHVSTILDYNDSVLINIIKATNYNALKLVPKFKYLSSIFTEDGKNKEDKKQWIKGAEVMFNNKKQLLCSK